MAFRSPSRALVGAALALIAIALIGTLGAVSGPASAAVGAHRLGAAPMLPRGAKVIGRLSVKPLSVDVALSPRDPAALSAYAAGVTDPASRDYHHYLTIAQLRADFAPGDAQLAEVKSTLTAEGLTVTHVSANGLLVGVTASASRLDRAFRSGLDRVKLASHRVIYANARAPEVPAQIAGLVQGVVGLSDLDVNHPLGVVHRRELARSERAHAHARARRRAAGRSPATSAPTPCSDASGAGTDYGAYTADEIASTYGFTHLYGAGDFGAGQTIGLVEFEKYDPGDVQTFESCYGIDGGTGSDVTETDVDGGLAADPTYNAGPYGSGESILDIDQILGLAPAANIDVYEAPNTSKGSLDLYTEMLDNSSMKVISTSWGSCEPQAGDDETAAATEAAAENTIFQEMAAEGISVFAAAGDDGSNDCFADGLPEDGGTGPRPELAVDDPGSQPYVTSVGGTSLPADDDPAGQTVWNDSGTDQGAGGGGISTFWSMPAYQQDASPSLNVINANSSASLCDAPAGTDCREVPDVSADADPQTGYVDYWAGTSGFPGSGWAASGGTSAAAPLWAAITALANADPACENKPVGEANPVLYTIADNATDYANAFTDVTSGDNAYSDSGYTGALYPAGTGYDMASGLGAPNVASLVPDMCSVVVSGTAGGLGGGSGETGAPTTTTGTTPPPTTTTRTTATQTSTSQTSTTQTSTTQTTARPPATTTAAPPATTTSNSAAGHCVSASILATITKRVLKVGRPVSTSTALTGTGTDCVDDTLTLLVHVSTSLPRRAGAVDTLKLQLTTPEGKVLTTLGTLSNRNAKVGYQILAYNVTKYAGLRWALRLTSHGSGAGKTDFTLKSAKVTVA